MHMCLGCMDIPRGFESRLDLIRHVRIHHRDLLEDGFHEAELMHDVSVEPPAPRAPAVGPYVCLRCNKADTPPEQRTQRAQIESHVRGYHNQEEAEYGEDYLSVSDYKDHLQAKVEARARENERLGDAFALRLASVATVGDFLTECRA